MAHNTLMTVLHQRSISSFIMRAYTFAQMYKNKQTKWIGKVERKKHTPTTRISVTPTKMNKTFVRMKQIGGNLAIPRDWLMVPINFTIKVGFYFVMDIQVKSPNLSLESHHSWCFVLHLDKMKTLTYWTNLYQDTDSEIGDMKTDFEWISHVGRERTNKIDTIFFCRARWEWVLLFSCRIVERFIPDLYL